jgi:hypothetical protein
MADDNEGVRVLLARIEGKLDLSNLRHDQTDAWKTTVDTRIQGHGERIGGLEGRERERTGERKGAERMVKVWSALGGGGVITVAAAVARHFQL